LSDEVVQLIASDVISFVPAGATEVVRDECLHQRIGLGRSSAREPPTEREYHDIARLGTLDQLVAKGIADALTDGRIYSAHSFPTFHKQAQILPAAEAADFLARSL
jgi:hypothetical protein